MAKLLTLLRRCGSKAKYKMWKKEHIIIYNIKTVHKKEENKH